MNVTRTTTEDLLITMNDFAMIDNRAIQHNEFVSLIDSRYLLKTKLLTNPVVGIIASQALKNLVDDSDSEVYKYAVRKITSFSLQANVKQIRNLLPQEIVNIECLVAKFVGDYKAIDTNDGLRNLNNKLTIARKIFKEKAKNDFNAHSDPKGPEALTAMLDRVSPTIQGLQVAEKTKAFLHYKLAYVQAFEV